MERLLSIIQIIAYLFLKNILSSRIVDVFELTEAQEIDILYNDAAKKNPQSASILQFNDTERNDICQDVIKSEFIRDMGISSITKNVLGSNYYIDVKEFDINGVHHNSIVLVCVAHKMAKNENFTNQEFSIIYAFEENLFFVVCIDKSKRSKFLAVLRTLPKYMIWDQQTLEEYFMKVWNTTENVKRLSPEISKKIEEQNIVNQIQDDENIMDFICASVLRTKFYRLKFVEFKWMQEDNVFLDLKGQWLSFKTSKYKKMLRFVQGFICRAYINYVPQYYYVSWSFIDDRSLFVQRVGNQFNFLELFVYDIPT